MEVVGSSPIRLTKTLIATCSEGFFIVWPPVLPPDVITSNKAYLIDSASPYLFGLLSSTTHMAWMRTVAGRMKSDYSYSGSLVYNNYPFPPAPTEAQH